MLVKDNKGGFSASWSFWRVGKKRLLKEVREFLVRFRLMRGLVLRLNVESWLL